MTTQSEEIKRLVRERYGGRARQVIELAAVAQPSGDACCSPQDMDEALHIYEEGQLAELPAESIAASLGCGNPTALAGLQGGRARPRPGIRRGHRLLPGGQPGGRHGPRHRAGHDARYAGVGPQEPSHPRSDERGVRSGRDGGYALPRCVGGRGHLELRRLPLAGQGRGVPRGVPRAGPRRQDAHLRHDVPLRRGSANDDLESWVACSTGAEPREVYLGRLSRAGFTDIAIAEDASYCADEGLSSVKVVAHKPA